MTNVRILVTTPSEMFRGLLAEQIPGMEDCYHFSGLYKETHSDSGGDKVEFDADVARLAKLVSEKNPELVLFGAWGHHVYFGSLEAAQYLLKHTQVKAVLFYHNSASRRHKESELDISLFSLTSMGLQLVDVIPANRHTFHDALATATKRYMQNMSAEKSAA